MGDSDEADALAWLCGNLADLRRSAARGGWTTKLAKAVDSVRRGGSVLAVLRRLGYADQPAGTRGGWPGDVPAMDRLGVRAQPVLGSYHCPRELCSRAGEAALDATEPYCEVFQAALAFAPDPAGTS
jgi:hypothetical protein